MKLAALFSDHMVLQRNQVVAVWGWDTPGTNVRVELAGAQASAVAGADGKFLAKLPPMGAGGPFTMTVVGTDTRVVQDILVGEVWIASGQSNMEWQLSVTTDAGNALAEAPNFPSIRLFTVPRIAEVEVQADVDAQWKVCSTEWASAFSAVAYYFGRMLHRQLGVPVGLINTSWGGTIAEAWTSRQALQNEPTLRPMITAYDEHLSNKDLRAEYDKKYKQWYDTHVTKDPGNGGLEKGWHDPVTATSNWKQMDLPQHWQKVEELNFSGVLWFRREVDVPAAWAGRDLQLSLGPVDKSDITYFNGQQVGSLSIEQNPASWCTPRVYTVPGSLVKAGRNVVAVRVFSNMYAGGFGGSAEQMRLAVAGDGAASIALAGSWRYEIERTFGPTQPPAGPAVPQGRGNPNSPTILYNSMIAPLIPYGIAGAIWYQGESNADRPYQYRTLFQTMIRCWRQDWGLGDFPFLFVQLANFMPVQKQPVRSGWAELREAQTLALGLPNTGMAVIIDIGEAGDIHPRNKKDVGERLALWALAKTYGFANLVHSGPLYDSCTIEGSSVRVRFTHIGGGLLAKGGGDVKGFAIAGADRKFVWADAKIDGQTVVVSSPAVAAPVAVRYAWADNPVCNLYNTSDLPASPFRTDDWTEA